MTSRYTSIRADNTPSTGVISFKNGFPLLSFTLSAQNGLLDPSTIRVNGKFAAYKDNLAVPTALQSGDQVTMNNRLGIFNVIESLTIRAARSKLSCESIRGYSKLMNSYLSMTSSLQDQMGNLNELCLCQPNSETFRKSVMESPTATAQTNSFSTHLPCGFLSSGNMVDLRQDAFGGIIIEILLMPDSNVLYSQAGSSTGIGDAHYELSDLSLTCEISDIPDDDKPSDSGVYEFNTITSLYSSINSTNAQIQYTLALQNVLSAFMTFVPVRNINTLTEDGQVCVQLSGDGASDTALAPITRVQWLKGGTKYPADFDYVTNIVDPDNTATMVVDPQLINNFIDSILPDYTHERFSISPVNCNRDYNMTNSATVETSYGLIPEGGSVYGLGVKYGIGGAGEDFRTEQFGVSIESNLKSDRPQGMYIFIKARAQLMFDAGSIQLKQ